VTDFAALVESLPVVVYASSLTGDLEYLSPAVEGLTGHDAATLLARAWSDVVHPDDRERLAAARRDAAEGPLLVEYRVEHADGSIVWVRDAATKIGERLVGALSDVSGTKRAEAERAQEARVKTVADLAGGIAHEINNPLAGVLGYAQLAQRLAGSEPKLAKSLDGILVEGRRALEVTERLLSLARDDGDFCPVDPGAFVRSTLTPFKCVLKDDYVLLTVEVEPGLPPMRARGRALRQVLQSLLFNAQEALNARFPKRDPEKRLTVRVAGGAEDTIRIDVEDQGEGLADDAERAFRPFLTTRQGIGLGLTIARQIVREHGGRIDVTSEAGSGSTFSVFIPVFA
jgi:PAS domain S-box-containing protein